jgi:hypothetical protein
MPAQNRSLNLCLEREKQKVAKLQQALAAGWGAQGAGQAAADGKVRRGGGGGRRRSSRLGLVSLLCRRPDGRFQQAATARWQLQAGRAQKRHLAPGA